MEVFINRIPAHCSNRDLERFLREPLAQFGIKTFDCEKVRNKPFAKVVFLDVEKGKRFLAKYGLRDSQTGPLSQLSMNGHRIRCALSKNQPEEMLLRSLAAKGSRSTRSTHQGPSTDGNHSSSTFVISAIRCGIWTYVNNELTFEPHFIDSRRGKIIFGHRQAAVIYQSDGNSQLATRININYFDIDSVTTGNYRNPTITFALQFPPSFYSLPSPDIAEMMVRLGFANGNAPPLRPRKARITSIDVDHRTSVGTCFVYQLQLADHQELSNVFRLLQRNHNIASTVSHSTPTAPPQVDLQHSFRILDFMLSGHGSHGKLHFDIKFQLLRLARNGALQPEQVIALLQTITLLKANHDTQAIVESIKRLYRKLYSQILGPHTLASDYTTSALSNQLLDYAQNYDRSRTQNPYEIANRHDHMVLVHKLTVTPAGVYLEGPDPETSNRVLREYEEHCNHFLRVTFCDEDGEPVHYEPQSDQKEMYRRFQHFMEGKYVIADRAFSFLGFSHSSLRSQTCWFMSPFQHQGNTISATQLIQRLGDFGHIRSPARCAARIGQAFTDTTGTVKVEASVLVRIPDVERNGRCFSDGCGTISLSMLRKVWRVYGVRRTVKPTTLQIRYAGAKGVVSLDSTLVEDQFNIRPSMEKFTGSGSTTLEVCGAAWRPYPLVLNRQFIKILEDLEVPLSSSWLCRTKQWRSCV